jgi:hypothetical protein
LKFKLNHNPTIYALVDGTKAYHAEVGRETMARSSQTGPEGRMTKMALRARSGEKSSSLI